VVLSYLELILALTGSDWLQEKLSTKLSAGASLTSASPWFLGFLLTCRAGMELRQQPGPSPWAWSPAATQGNQRPGSAKAVQLE
jgi:hypothetical protein